MEDTTTTTPAPALPAASAPLNEFEACPLDKPSRLIRLALADLISCQTSGRYNIDMDVWHYPNPYFLPGNSNHPEVECTVCLAGAVLAQTFRVEPEVEVKYLRDVVDNVTAYKLSALNMLRAGMIAGAFRELGLPSDDTPPGVPRSVEVSAVHLWPEFLEDMERLAATLATAGY